MNQVLLNDRYQLDRLLGRKSGRRTWLAIDGQTQQQVVIKLLLFSADFEWDALKLFERESKTLQDLDHPAIPKYLDWFETNLDGNAAFALVQTYIPAPSLDAVVRSGRTFSSDDLRNIAEQVLQILDYLHSRNPYVIHRDLKPSNLLLGDRTGNSPGTVYLVDFGSVQNLAIAKGGTMTIVGTYGYMPPEQFGDRAVPASDLYSLGATLIHLATGKDPADLLSDDFQIQCDSMNHLEPDFRNWIQGLVVTSLRDRPSSVQEAIDRLVYPKTKAISEPKSSSVWTQRVQEEENFKFKKIENSNELFVLKIPAHRIEVKLLAHKIVRFRDFISVIAAIPFVILILLLSGALSWTAVIYSIDLYAFVVFLLSSFMFFIVTFSIFYLINKILVRSKSRILTIDQNNIQLSQILRNRDINRDTKNRVLGWWKEVGVLRESITKKHLLLNFKEKVWEIEFSLSNSGDFILRQIDLKVGLQVWIIRGGSDELRWLLGELSYYLQIEPTPITLPTQSEGSIM